MKYFIIILCIFIFIFFYYNFFYKTENLKNEEQKIYIIVTTSINDEKDEIRKNQYETSISKLIELTKDIVNKQIIIVENNGQRKTYLDNFNLPVLYTENNFNLPVLYKENNFSKSNKGNKELLDVLECINKFNIKDNDFIVKITGRYLLEDNSNFIKKLHNLNDFQCLIRYGAYYNSPSENRMKDCITGLIGLLCYYVKQIKLMDSNDSAIEWNWAEVTYSIELDKIYIFDNLGINICPGSNDYFLV